MLIRIFVFTLLFISSSYAEISGIQTGKGKADVLNQRLQVLEKDLIKLRKQSTQLEPISTGTPANLAAHLEIRLGQADREMRKLSNKMEELSYQFARLESYISRMNREYDRRLAVLEQKTGTILPAVQVATPIASQPMAPVTKTPTTVASEPRKILKLVNKTDQKPIKKSAKKDAPKTIEIPVEELFEKGRSFLARKKYKQAAHVFKKFVSAKPKSPLAGDAQFLAADSYFLENDFTNAAIEYVKVYEIYPTSPKAPEALLKLAKSLHQIGQRVEACEALGVIKSQYKSQSAAHANAQAREMESILSCGS